MVAAHRHRFVVILAPTLCSSSALAYQFTADHHRRRRTGSATTTSVSRLTAAPGSSNDDNYFPSLPLRTTANSNDKYSHTKDEENNNARPRINNWQQSLSSSREVVLSFKDKQQLQTLSRILLPSLLAGIAASLVFPPLALFVSYLINDAATFAVLSVDSSQFIQNFLTVTGLTFSILVGQTYYFMYQQQEAVFISLFREVTEAKCLLEQLGLVCQGRHDMYTLCLTSLQRYIQDDLRLGLYNDPAIVLSSRPMDDPLEVILYSTSVGVPSCIYDTIRSLRQTRALRLGAYQKKLPSIHFNLLWLLAAIELCCFPILGAGTQTIGGYNILTIEGCLFGIMTFGIVLTLNVVGEMYVGVGGAYNVDEVLQLMVHGLNEELEMRMRGIVTTATTIATTTTNNRNNNSMMDERAQLINEDNVLPQTRIPSVSFVPSQTMALGEDI